MSNKKKTKKKTTAQPQQQLTPKNYILTGRARTLPIAECWISTDWKEAGICSIVVARRHTSGNMTFGMYLLDIFCLGLKNTNYLFNNSEYEYKALVEKIYSVHDHGKIPIDYTLAHNIIFGCIAYSEDLGFKPEKDWAITQMILEEDTEDVELIEVEFGKNGKPYFINGPYDNVQKVVNTLNKSVGQGNYEMMYMLGNLNRFDDDFDDDDDDDDDEDEIQDVDYEEVKR